MEVSGLLSNPRLLSTLTDLWEILQDPKKSTSVNRAEPAEELVRAEPTQHSRCPRLTQAEIAALVKTFSRGGINLVDLSKLFGIHRQTAAKHLDRAQLTDRRKGLSQQQISEAIHLYREGWSLAQLGERFAVWPSSVGYRLKQKGVKLRSRPGR